MPSAVRAASFVPSTFNAEKRTVEVVFSTGSRVRRFDWWTGKRYEEELEISSDAVDLSRLNGGASVLNTHSDYTLEDVIGVVERAWVDGAEARAVLRLSDRESIAEIVQDIQSGILRNISVGYTTERMQITPAESRTDGGTVELRTATRWTPHEVSFVPVPADADAGVRSLSPDFNPNDPEAQRRARMAPCEVVTRVLAPAASAVSQPMESSMTNPTAAAAAPLPAAPAVDDSAVRAAVAAEVTQRNLEIVTLCQRHAVPAEQMQAFIKEAKTVDQVRAAILDAQVEAPANKGGQININPSIRTLNDEGDTIRRGLENALANRVDGTVKLDENGRRFRGLGLIEMGRSYLAKVGVNTEGLAASQVADLMTTHRSAAPGFHTSSDFGGILANVMGKRLRSAYEEASTTYQMWARRAENLRDFKPVSVLAMSGAPNLLPLNEAGEIRYGTMGEGSESYGAAEYARIVALSRRMIINDDLSALSRAIALFGASARRLENGIVTGILTTNANMADGTALFAAGGTRNNLFTGGGTVLAESQLGVGRAAMRRQRGLSTGDATETAPLLNLTPRYLLVPSALEQTAYKFTSSQYVPATQAATNEFREGGKTAVMPIIEPLLDDASTTAWYLLADSSQIDTVEYAYLDGEEGPQIFTKDGWEVEGIEIKCRHTFAAKAIDPRGMQRHVGA